MSLSKIYVKMKKLLKEKNFNFFDICSKSMLGIEKIQIWQKSSQP
jgi:hypothetical protein